MAISDKVIELSPVNKKKDVIFYIIMGVLLATTALFLVLYLLKPNVVDGQISSIELSGDLFVEEDGSWSAVPGSSYTICARVGYSGEIDTSLSLQNPNSFNLLTYDNITEEDKVNSVKNASYGESVGESEQYYYYKFEVPANAQAREGERITLTPNLTDNKGNPVFESVARTINIRPKGAVGIDDLTIYARNNNAALELDKTGEADYVIRVPYIEGAALADRQTYTVMFKQLPQKDKNGHETVVTSATISGSNYLTNSVVVGDNTVSGVALADCGVNNEKTTDSFYFRPGGKGSSIITLTLNKYNSDNNIDIKFRVESDTPANLDMITAYHLMPTAVGNKEPDYKDEVDEVNIYVGDKYDFTSFIAVTPFTRQSDWNRSVSLAITSDKAGEKPDATVVGRVPDAKNGMLAIEAKQAGTAYVWLTDTSDGNVGTVKQIKVNAVYRVTDFGYNGTVTPEKTVTVSAIKGGKGMLDLTFVAQNGTEIKSGEINAEVKVEGLSKGMTITDMDSESGVVELVSQGGKPNAQNRVIMTATLEYELASNVSDESFEITVTALGMPSPKTLTIKFIPTVEITKLKFIGIDKFDAIVENSNNALMQKYASFEYSGEKGAVLTLNMSKQSVPLTLSDLILLTDADGTNVLTDDAAIREAAKNVNVEISGSDPGAVTFNDPNSKFVASIFPQINNSSSDGGSTLLKVSLKNGAENESLLLNIIVTDNPEQIVYEQSSVATTFYYSSLVGNVNGSQVQNAMPSTVNQTYASGTTRAVTGYFPMIFIDTAEGEKELYASSVNDGKVYYFLDEAELNAYIADGEQAVYAARNALLSVSGGIQGANKSVYLLKDIYFHNATVGTANAINRIGFKLVPSSYVSESEGKLTFVENDFVSSAYYMSAVRLMDDLKLDGLEKGESGGYAANASGGQPYDVTPVAIYSVGSAGDTVGDEQTIAYKNLYGNESLQQINYSASDGVTHEYNAAAGALRFTMPSVEGDVMKQVTLSFSPSGLSSKTITLTLDVQNRTLPIESITLYVDSGCTEEYENDDQIFLSASDNYDSLDIYFKVQYPEDANLGEYLQYDTVISTLEEVGSSLVDTVRVYNPGTPSSGERTIEGYFTLSANRGASGKTQFAVISQMLSDGGGAVCSQLLNIIVYVPSSSIELKGIGGAPDVTSPDYSADINLQIGDSSTYPSVKFELNKKADVAFAGMGGTVFEVSVDEDGYYRSYNVSAQNEITIVFDRTNAVNETVIITIDEYAVSPFFDDEYINSYTIELTVNVTVLTYDIALSIDGGTQASGGGVSFNTLGTDQKIESELSVVLNGGDPLPDDTSYEYVLEKNGVRVTSETGAFYLSGDKLVYDDSVSGLGSDKYVLYARAGKVESNKIPLYLTTSMQYMKVDSVTQNGTALSYAGDTINVYDISAPISIAVGVYNRGTDVKNNAATVTYKVVGSGATITNAGVLTITDEVVTFKVLATADTGEPKEITVNVENEVTEIVTHFESEYVLGSEAAGITFGYDDEYISLFGHEGTTPYTNEFTITRNGPTNVASVTFDSAAKTFTITFNAAGTQTFTVSALSRNGSSKRVTTTFTLTIVRPQLKATIDGANKVTVNLVDDSALTVFDIATSVAPTTYTVSDVTMTGEGITDGKFTYNDGKLTVNKSAFDENTFTAPKTYTFTVSAKVDGVTAYNTVTLSVEITASKPNGDWGERLFDLRLGNTVLQNGATLEFARRDGEYEVVAKDGYTLSYSIEGLGASLSGGKLYFETVGSLTIRATLTKYGVTFTAGEITFAVKNDAETLVGTLKDRDGNALASTPIEADYFAQNESDKTAVTYTVDFGATGESSIAQENIKLFISGGTLTDTQLNSSDITYTIRIDEPGTLRVSAVLSVGARYYVSGESSATFTMNKKPTSVSATDIVLSDRGGTFDNVSVNGYTDDNDTIVYELVGSSDIIKINSDGSYTVEKSEYDETVSVKVTYTVVGGYYDGMQLSVVFTVTALGEKKATVEFAALRYLLPGETLQLADVLNITYGDNKTAAKISATLSSGAFTFVSLSSDHSAVTAKETDSGSMSVSVSVSVAFESAMWGNYTIPVECTVAVLPKATFTAAQHVQEGGSLKLNLSAGGNDMSSSLFEITSGGTLGTIVGDTFYANSGVNGTVTVTATPYISTTEFGAVALEAKTVTFTVHSLSVPTSVTLKAGGSKNFTTSDFAVSGGVTVNSISLTSNSGFVTISGSTVTVKDGVNAYSGRSAPDDITVTLNVTAIDANNLTYTNQFEIKIQPTLVEFTATVAQGEYKMIVGQSKTFEFELKEGGEKVEAFCMNCDGGDETWRLFGSVSGKKMSVTFTASAATAPIVMKPRVTVDGHDYELPFTYTISFADVSEVTIDSSRAKATIAVGTSNVYVFASADGVQNITQVTLDGIASQLYTVEGLDTPTVTVTITPSAAGKLTFTPKLELSLPVQGSSEYITHEVSFGAISFDAVAVADTLSVSAVVNGAVVAMSDDTVNAVVGDSVTFTVSGEYEKIEYRNISSGMSNVGGVFTSATAGTYKVTIAATKSGKTVTKEMTIIFAPKETAPTLTVSVENGKLKASEGFAISRAFVTSGNAELSGDHTLTFTDKGAVTVVVYAVYNVTESNFNGMTFDYTLTISASANTYTEPEPTLTASAIYEDGEIVIAVPADFTFVSAEPKTANVTVNGNKLTFTAEGEVQVEVTATYVKASSDHNNKTYTCTITLVSNYVAPETAPTLTVSVENGKLKASEGFALSRAFVTSGNAEIGNDYALTFTDKGAVTVVVYAVYNVTESNFNGMTFDYTLTISASANTYTEPEPTLTASAIYEDGEIVITVPADFTFVSATPKTANVTVNGNKLTFTAEGEAQVEVTATYVKASSDHNNKTYTCTLTLVSNYVAPETPEQEPTFDDTTVSLDENGKVTLPTDFALISVSVVSGGAVVENDGDSFKVTFTESGEVVIRVVAQYENEDSEYNGKLYKTDITVNSTVVSTPDEGDGSETNNG